MLNNNTRALSRVASIILGLALGFATPLVCGAQSEANTGTQQQTSPAATTAASQEASSSASQNGATTVAASLPPQEAAAASTSASSSVSDPSAAPAAVTPAPAPQPLPTPAMTEPLQTAAPPHTFGAGPFGTLAITGILSGLGMTQDNRIAGDKSSNWDISNGQVFVQKTTGWWQFYLQGGPYNLRI